MEEFQRTRALLFWERFYWSVEFSSEWALSEEFDYHILRDAGRPRERQFLTYNSSSYTIRERRSKTTSVRNSVIYSLKSEKRPLPSPTPKRSITLRNWSVRGAPYFSDRIFAEKQVTELGGFASPSLKDDTGKNSSKNNQKWDSLKTQKSYRYCGAPSPFPDQISKVVFEGSPYGIRRVR